MINYFTYLICGSYKVTVQKEYKEITLNYLFSNKIKYRNLIHFEDGISFDILSFLSKKLTDFFEKRGIPYSISKLHGIPNLIQRYKNRIGILFGLITFCFIVTVSQNYVWYIDVKGCENVSPSTVTENLEALGFTYGTNYKKLDFDYLRHNYLAANDDLCWISINMQGTYAHVEVRELKDPPEESTSACTNVVASEQGQVILVECFEGAPAVSPGDFVSMGDLLISGLMTSGEDELRYERADGKVLAEVTRKFKAVIPKNKIDKIYIDDEKNEYELIFFKKNVKVSGNCRISYKEYDTIINKKQLSLFGFADLPVFLITKLYQPYETIITPYNDSELSDLKKKLISERTAEIVCDAELLDVTTCELETDGEIIIIGTVTCIADIGEAVEVNVSN